MGINIKVNNTKMSDKVKALNNVASSSLDDISIELNDVDMKDEAELLNNLTNTQINEVLKKLEDHAKLLEQTGKDYEEIKELFEDLQNSRLSAREVLRQHVPNLITGTLANIIGNLTVR